MTFGRRQSVQSSVTQLPGMFRLARVLLSKPLSPLEPLSPPLLEVFRVILTNVSQAFDVP